MTVSVKRFISVTGVTIKYKMLLKISFYVTATSKMNVNVIYLKKAIEAVSNDSMSKRKAAFIFGVPRTILIDRILG